jgi:hypothetical protein
MMAGFLSGPTVVLSIVGARSQPQSSSYEMILRPGIAGKGAGFGGAGSSSP